MFKNTLPLICILSLVISLSIAMIAQKGIHTPAWQQDMWLQKDIQVLFELT